MRTQRLGGGLFAAVALAAIAFYPARASDIVPPKIVMTGLSGFFFGTNPEVPDRGTVEVAVAIDQDNRLTDWLVLRSTHPAFTRAVPEILAACTCTAARWDGKPISVRTSVALVFEAHGRIVSGSALDFVDRGLRGWVQPPWVEHVANSRELDRGVEVLERVGPGYPAALAATDKRGGNVVVDFYVDADGRVRLPAVTSSDDPNFSASVMNALSRWKFSVPTRGGKPVSAHVRQTFVFNRPG